MTHRAFMQKALDLALQGNRTCTPNPMVGCVLVDKDENVHVGRHMKAGEAHAEIEALDTAREAAKGSTMYVNLEPCSHHGRTPPCVDRIIASGVSKVHVAMLDPDPRNNGKGIEALRNAGIECEVGLLEDAARWLNRGFVSRVVRKRPWLMLKTASTMDGRIALEQGKQSWLTCERSRNLVHRMRADSCAIMTGSGTALADDPRLTARDVGAIRQPLRFLVDSKGRCPATLRLFDGGAVLVTASDPPEGLDKQVEVLRMPDKDNKVDLVGLLAKMSSRWQVNLLMVEAGSRLAGALLSQGLVDEIAAFVAPSYLGGGLNVADFAVPDNIDGAPRFRIRNLRTVGEDALLTLVNESAM